MGRPGEGVQGAPIPALLPVLREERALAGKTVDVATRVLEAPNDPRFGSEYEALSEEWLRIAQELIKVSEAVMTP
jgi:hypothetical protein